MIVETLGFLLRDGEVVSLAQERLEGPTYRCVTHVPRAMVLGMEELT